MPTIFPFSRPLYVMLKPCGAQCNLACDYCYYLEKGHLYEGGRQQMSDELLEKFVKEYISSQTMREVLFTWHGGEPLLRPLSFYEKALRLQQKYGGGRPIDNCIQTNGTLLTEEWCRFLHDHHWLVGLSIDGPAIFHDAYRKNRHGSPTFDKVMRGIDMLNRYEVEWNAMAVVNDKNADHPLEFYHFFKQIGCHYIQFTPIVERHHPHSDGRHLASASESGGQLTSHSVTPGQWGHFICTIFDDWVRHDVGDYYIQLFDATLANWVGEPPGVCSLGRTCGHAGVMEYNGDVYPCDHFVFPEYKLGNLYSQTLVEMLYGERQQQFGRAKEATLPRQCRRCPYLFACHGECPKNRFCKTADGEDGLNYLCKGYYRFFRHAAPYMDYMKSELESGRAPSNIMQALREGLIDTDTF